MARLTAARPNRSLRMDLSLLPGAYLPRLRQKGESAFVGAVEQLGERLAERAVRLDRTEQGEGGAELHRIDRSEHLFGAALACPWQERFDTLAKPGPEERMGQISASLILRADPVILRGGAVPEPSELWEDEPHPMALLAS